MFQSRRGDPQEETSPKPNIGRKLVIILLPLVLIPMVSFGTAAYLRTQSVLRTESLKQMTFALRSQVLAVDQWFHGKENALDYFTQDQALILELNSLIENTENIEEPVEQTSEETPAEEASEEVKEEPEATEESSESSEEVPKIEESEKPNSEDSE